MTEVPDLSAAIAKIDQALQQIEQALKDWPGSLALEMAKASLEIWWGRGRADRPWSLQVRWQQARMFGQ